MWAYSSSTVPVYHFCILRVYLTVHLEHDHSHGDASHGKKSGHVHGEGHQEETESGAVTPTQDGGRGRRRSDSLYGHPVATRAYLVQAAEDLQNARSPTRRDESPLSSHKRETIHRVLSSENTVVDDEDDSSSSNDRTEATPLLNGHKHKKSSRADSVIAPDAHSEHGKSRNHGGHSHSKSGSMNMRALVLHVMGDALGNVGVIATGLIIWLSDYSWKYYCDPIISLVITVIIFSSALPLGGCFHNCIQACL